MFLLVALVCIPAFIVATIAAIAAYHFLYAKRSLKEDHAGRRLLLRVAGAGFGLAEFGVGSLIALWLVPVMFYFVVVS